jgi:hypothetical protein
MYTDDSGNKYYRHLTEFDCIAALRARIEELTMPEEIRETIGDLCKLLKDNLTVNSTNYNIYYLDVVMVENWLTAARKEQG